jgi:hypothetical protein
MPAVAVENLQVGDVVTVRGSVTKYISGVGAEVEVFSRNGPQRVWIREDHVELRLTEAVDADEPPLASYVETTEVDGAVVVWHRYPPGWLAIGSVNRPGDTPSSGLFHYEWRTLKASVTSWRLLGGDV